MDSYYITFSGIILDGGKILPITKEELFQGYKNKTVTGIIFGIIITPLTLLECQDTVDSSKGIGESVDSMFSKERKKILDILDSDP